MIRIGIVGHRFLEESAAAFAAEQCAIILQQWKTTHPGIIALSAIAEGADSIFAEAALALNIPLEIVLPFTGYETDFVKEEALQTYRQLKTAATKKTKLLFSERSEDAYAAAMKWILEKSDIIVVIWNGDKNGGRGGTSDAVKKIIRNGLDWIYIDIFNFSVNWHVKETGLLNSKK